MTTETLLTLPEVCASIRLEKSWVYQAIQRHEFPAPIHLTPRRVAWRASEIDAWKLARIEESVAAREAR